MNKQKILFVCTHNSARSIMAEAILRSIYGSYYEVYSAGTLPSSVNPYVTSVLAELEIKTNDLSSKSVDEFLDREIDILVTVCDSAKEECPYLPGAKHIIHKSFQDPSTLSGTDEEIMIGFKRVRDEIWDWIGNEFKPKTRINVETNS